MIQISEWGWIWRRWFNTKFTPQTLVLHIRVKRWFKWTHILGSNDWYNTFGVIFRFKPRYLVQHEPEPFDTIMPWWPIVFVHSDMDFFFYHISLNYNCIVIILSLYMLQWQGGSTMSWPCTALQGTIFCYGQLVKWQILKGQDFKWKKLLDAPFKGIPQGSTLVLFYLIYLWMTYSILLKPAV